MNNVRSVERTLFVTLSYICWIQTNVLYVHYHIVSMTWNTIWSLHQNTEVKYCHRNTSSKKSPESSNQSVNGNSGKYSNSIFRMTTFIWYCSRLHDILYPTSCKFWKENHLRGWRKKSKGRETSTTKAHYGHEVTLSPPSVSMNTLSNDMYVISPITIRLNNRVYLTA